MASPIVSQMETSRHTYIMTQIVIKGRKELRI